MKTSTWFEHAVRPEHVAAELRESVPELLADPGLLTGCRIIRLRAAEDEGHWTATYLLDLGDRTVSAHGLLVPPDAAPPASDTMQGQPTPFAGDGWSQWLPRSRVLLHTRTRDDAIPGLAAMTDPPSALEVLQPLLAETPDGRAAMPVDVTTTVAAYKPGVRVTLICDLAYAPEPATSDSTAAHPGPRAVVVKATAGDDALVLHEAQCALWDSPLGSDARVRIARPIAHVPELLLAVQSHLDHDRTLKDLLADAFAVHGVVGDPAGGPATVRDAAPPDPTMAVRATGAALAALHSSGVAHGGVVSFSDELATLRRKHDSLAGVVPWLAELTDGALDRLASAAESSAVESAVPSHGSFRTAQVLLLADGGIGLIDLDKLRQAEPAADIGPFLAKLRHTAVNKGSETGTLPDEPTRTSLGSRVDALREAFLSGYEEHAALSRQRVAVWEGLELVALVVGAAKKGMAERGDSCARMLRAHLDVHDL
ncbi:hypothetical protein GA707_01705 [Nostocoides sp. F2B08]|uniref:phosphotransferase n=1 Tax=Nostocoides sp. F2B08 TaxID=2653936 RepID=UPI0012636011|nr:phosphotransferase [Tetrasphaera sp. F2B08]KAB7746261.1 hypothetical protein GA707_01705 [Tetrasphaera sp. F2B08]